MLNLAEPQNVHILKGFIVSEGKNAKYPKRQWPNRKKRHFNLILSHILSVRPSGVSVGDPTLNTDRTFGLLEAIKRLFERHSGNLDED